MNTRGRRPRHEPGNYPTRTVSATGTSPANVPRPADHAQAPQPRLVPPAPHRPSRYPPRPPPSVKHVRAMHRACPTSHAGISRYALGVPDQPCGHIPTRWKGKRRGGARDVPRHVWSCRRARSAWFPRCPALGECSRDGVQTSQSRSCWSSIHAREPRPTARLPAYTRHRHACTLGEEGRPWRLV